MGARLVRADAGFLVVEMEVRPDHYDHAGRLASGVLFSLADCAMSLISNQARTEVAVATHLTRSGSGGEARTLRAEIAPVSIEGDRATTWRALVTADGSTIAAFTGTTLAVGGPGARGSGGLIHQVDESLRGEAGG
jgi:uncharacterized protein (TIGR00369 family)